MTNKLTLAFAALAMTAVTVAPAFANTPPSSTFCTLACRTPVGTKATERVTAGTTSTPLPTFVTQAGTSPTHRR